jgi:acetyl-CoA carboxylase biotin carboxyl carrier protein
MDWEDADVRAILQLVDAAGFDELEIETDRFSLYLRRSEDGAEWTRESRTLGAVRELAADDGADTAPGSAAAAAAAAVAGGAAPEAEGEAGTRDEGSARWLPVRTPLPGTFYRAPQPGAMPFVEIGTPVTADTVVAIVETMKLMNSVYAGVSGRIAAIGAEDGSFVPQHAVLMQIEPGVCVDGT